MDRLADDLDLAHLSDVLDPCVSLATAAKLPETAMLPRIARLDVLMRANGITKEELESFLFATKHKALGLRSVRTHPRCKSTIAVRVPSVPKKAGLAGFSLKHVERDARSLGA